MTQRKTAQPDGTCQNWCDRFSKLKNVVALALSQEDGITAAELRVALFLHGRIRGDYDGKHHRSGKVAARLRCREIADAIGIDAATVSRALKSLADRGFIELRSGRGKRPSLIKMSPFYGLVDHVVQEEDAEPRAPVEPLSPDLARAIASWAPGASDSAA